MRTVPIEYPKPKQLDRTAVAELAYRYWEERGCPSGSPEEDWYRAEAGLRGESNGLGHEHHKERTEHSFTRDSARPEPI
jgi:hypothetical protein